MRKDRQDCKIIQRVTSGSVTTPLTLSRLLSTTFRYHLLILSLLVLQDFFQLLPSLNAETREIHELKFSIDELVPVGDDAFKITLNGDTRVVPSTLLHQRIVEHALEKGDFFATFDSEAIQRFISLAVQKKEVSIASRVLAAYLNSSDTEQSVKISYLLSLPKTGDTYFLFSSVLRSEDSMENSFVQNIDPYLLSVMWLYGSSLEGDNKESSALLPSVALSDTDISQALLKLLTEEQGDSIDISSLLSAARRGFRDTTGIFKEISIAIQKQQALKRLQPKLERAILYPYLSFNDESLEYQLLRPIVIEKLHSFAGFALENKAPLSALILLAELFPQERSLATQELVSRALKELPVPSEGLSANRLVRKLLTEESRNSPMVNSAFTDYLKREFDAYMTKGSIRAAGRSRETLRSINQQNQSEYDEMVFQEAIYWFRKQQPDVGNELLELRSTNPSFYEQLSLFWSGRYGSPVQLTLMGLIPVLLLLYLYLRRRHQRDMHAQYAFESTQDSDGATTAAFDPSNRESSDIEERSKRNMRSPFNTGAFKYRESPELREYRELLKKLSLSKDVGLRDIKKAYRSLIKKVHPDAQQGASEENDHAEAKVELSEDFIALSRVYERVLELRKVLGLPE